jgi:hypothetical protein
MTNWSWKFHSAKVADEDGLTDVLKSVGYQLTGIRGEKSFVIGGETALGAPDPATFKPFADLTEEDVEVFVASVVNIDALKTQINAWHDEVKKSLPFEEVVG